MTRDSVCHQILKDTRGFTLDNNHITALHVGSIFFVNNYFLFNLKANSNTQKKVINQILSASPSEASKPTNSVSEQLATIKQKEHLLIIPTEYGDCQIWGK